MWIYRSWELYPAYTSGSRRDLKDMTLLLPSVSTALESCSLLPRTDVGMWPKYSFGILRNLRAVISYLSGVYETWELWLHTLQRVRGTSGLWHPYWSESLRNFEVVTLYSSGSPRNLRVVSTILPKESASFESCGHYTLLVSKSLEISAVLYFCCGPSNLSETGTEISVACYYPRIANI